MYVKKILFTNKKNEDKHTHERKWHKSILNVRNPWKTSVGYHYHGLYFYNIVLNTVMCGDIVGYFGIYPRLLDLVLKTLDIPTLWHYSRTYTSAHHEFYPCLLFMAKLRDKEINMCNFGRGKKNKSASNHPKEV